MAPNIVIDLTGPSPIPETSSFVDFTNTFANAANAASSADEEEGRPVKVSPFRASPPKKNLTRPFVHRPGVTTLRSQSPFSTADPISPTIHAAPTPARQLMDRRTADPPRDTGQTANFTPPQRRYETTPSHKTVSPTSNLRTGNKMGSSKRQRSDSIQTSGPNRPSSPISHASGLIAQTTPRQLQTPKRLDWTVDKIAGRLKVFAKELVEQHNLLIYRMVMENSKRVKERRVFEGDDLFANVRLPPMPEDKKGLTARIKFKQHFSGSRRGFNGSLGKRTEIIPITPLKTNIDRVPAYRFHHIEINKNILTPQTRLDYIPHIRDVDESEESRYNRWLQELEEMEAASGFDTLTREERAAKTRRNECAARLAAILPIWLNALSISGCTKNTLIRYMATQAQGNAITPQQKTSILDSCGRDDRSGSPRAAAAAKMFTEAFDQVFFAELADSAPVTLRDVLVRDESVDNIVDPKRSAKDVAAALKPTELFRPEKTLLEQGYLETHLLFGCLICFSNSCEHGEYDAKNQKRTFSMEVFGGVEGALKRRAVRSAEVHATPEQKALYAQPCSDKCFRALGEAVFASERPWDPSELRSLRILVETSPTGPCHRPPECNAAGFLGRPCWAVHRKVNEIGVVPRIIKLPTSPRGPVKNLPWYDRWRKMLLGDWQEHSQIYEHARRDIVEPCTHDGPCTAEVGCPCVKAGVLCERFCRCTVKICPYKFTGCACHSLGKLCHAKQKERPCICVQLNRECDPGLCRGCGAAERADPVNREDDELHASGCQNCAVQRGKSKQVVIARSLLDGCGYGLLTAEDIAQDEFVIEYVGELIVHDEGVRREARRGDDVFCEHKNPSYVFALLEDEGIWVDGAVYGNLSRYINHAPDGNITPKILYVNHEYRIRFTALRDIKAGEELFFNYGDNFPNLTQKLLEDRADEEDALAASASSGRGNARKRGRGGGPRRGGAAGARSRARVQGGRKTAPTETNTEWDFVDAEPARKRRRTQRRAGEDGEDEDEEDEEDEEEEEGEEYRPENSEWLEGGSDGGALGRRRRRGGARGRGRGGRKRVRRVVRETSQIPDMARDRDRDRDGDGDEGGDSGGFLDDTPSKGPRARAARRVGLRSTADASNSESEDVMIGHQRDRRRTDVVNDSTDEVETRDEVTVGGERAAAAAAVGDMAGGGGVEGGDEDVDDEGLSSRGRRKVQVPARFRDGEQVSSG